MNKYINKIRNSLWPPPSSDNALQMSKYIYKIRSSLWEIDLDKKDALDIHVHPKHRGGKKWTSWMNQNGCCVVSFDNGFSSREEFSVHQIAMCFPGNSELLTITGKDIQSGRWEKEILPQIEERNSEMQWWALSKLPDSAMFTEENMEVMQLVKDRVEETVITADLENTTPGIAMSDYEDSADEFMKILESAVAVCGVLRWNVHPQIMISCLFSETGGFQWLADGKYTDKEGCKRLYIQLPKMYHRSEIRLHERYFRNEDVKYIVLAVHRQKARDSMRAFLMGMYTPKRSSMWLRSLHTLREFTTGRGAQPCLVGLLNKEVLQIIGDHLVRLMIGQQVARIFGDRVLRLR